MNTMVVLFKGEDLEELHVSWNNTLFLLKNNEIHKNIKKSNIKENRNDIYKVYLN